MTARNTLIFGAALAVATAAIAADHATQPVPPRPVYDAETKTAGAAPCAAGAVAPCAAGTAAPGAATLLAPPAKPAKRPAEVPSSLAPPPPLPKSNGAGEEAPDLRVDGT